jgi:predicted nucleic acid-binding protein
VVTFDTGALIALERRQQRIWKVFLRAVETDVRITVPAPVVAEWWRSRTDAREKVLAAVFVEPFTTAIAVRVGEAMAAVKGATLVDTIVMASAATRGGAVYTSDVQDLERLRQYFPSVRVFGV